MSDQPTYTRVPNDLIAAMPRLGNAELRVALAIARKTAGYQKECDRISVSQLADITGLTSRNTQQAITSLLKKDLIERTPAGKQAYCYSLKTISLGDTDQNHIPSDTISLGDTEPYPVGTRLETKPYPLGITQKKDLKEKKEKILRADRAPNSDHQKLMDLYANALPDRRIPNGKQEGAAAKAILAAGYTPEQAIQVYEYLKRRDFWADQHLSLQTVNKQMGAVIAATRSTNGHANGKLLRQSVNGPGERKPQVEADHDKPW